VIVFRYKSKKRYRRKTGHRQDYTYLTITDIQAEGESLVPDDERRRYEEAAARGAERYEARLTAAIDALAFDEAVGDADAIAEDEEVIETGGRSSAKVKGAADKQTSADAQDEDE